MFTPATAAWFRDHVGAPTPVQARGWPRIAAGEHTLLLAPTGSGKTLAAFLWSIDRLLSRPAGEAPGVRVLYVSPIKALVYDVRRNLGAPLAGIQEAAAALGQPVQPVRAALRTGDSTAQERRALLRAPPELLVTTPESLYLLLGSAARERLSTVETVILDEVHALAPTRRGAHLALSLERLAALCARDPQRIGLSATQRPPEVAAQFVCGDRPCAIVDCSGDPQLDLSLRVPVPDLRRPWEHVGAVAEPGDGEARSLWPALIPQLVAEIRAHRSTIVFVNSRGLAERLARRLDEHAGEPLALAHHGSLSHTRRKEVEEALKRGELRALVATSSMELGIDMGAVDCVLMVESPGTVARGLQRAGRAGHGVGQRSRAVLFPKHSGDLVECAALAERMLAAAIEPVRLPTAPLDVLCQQLVAMATTRPWTAEELLRTLGRAGSYRGLTRPVLDACLAMLCGEGLPPEAGLRPRLFRDGEQLVARRGAALVAALHAGTIPDRGLFGVFLAGSQQRLGELDEEMVYETRPGQRIVLGASTWRVDSIQRDRVLVSPAPGQPGRLPFWKGDTPGRPAALGAAIGAFVREVAEASPEAARARLAPVCDGFAVDNLLRTLAEQAERSALPTDRRLVLERARDELGEWRVALLSPYGARVHGPLALVMESMLVERRGLAPQSHASDEGVLLRLPELADPAQLPGARELLPPPEELRPRVLAALRHSALFAGRFREVAARALVLPLRGQRRRSPLWAQRLRGQELLAACGAHPELPLMVETWRECLQDLFDLDYTTELLHKIQRGEVAVVEVERERPSPFARALGFDWVAQHMYAGDAPQAERRAQALHLDSELLRQLLGERALAELVPPEVQAEVQAELDGRRWPPRDAPELLDLLRRVGDLSAPELAERGVPEALAEALVHAGGALWLPVGGEPRLVATEDAALFRDALGVRLPPTLRTPPHPEALTALALRAARVRVGLSARALAQRYGLPTGAAELALDSLEREGRLRPVVLGDGGLEGGPDGGPTRIEPGVLRRLRRRALEHSQGALAPVAPAALARAALGRRAADLDEALAALEGVPLPLAELEGRALPARLEGFEPRALDEALLSGTWVWVGRGEGQLALCRRERTTGLLYEPAPAPSDPPHQAILEVLALRGACFFAELQAQRPIPGLLDALWDLVWAGRVSNDTLQPLRAPGGPRRVGGRWWLTAPLFAPAAPEQVALWRVEALLARHGLVCPRAVEQAGWPGGFAALLPALRALEEQGRLVRGLFVEGLGGPQLAPASAVDLLRAAAGAAAVGDAVVVGALDPAQPYGALLPWPEGVLARRVAGARLVLLDGAPALWVAGERALSFAPGREAGALEAVAQALAASCRRGPGLDLAEVDGQPAARWVGAAALQAAGFVREGARLRRVVL